MHRCAITTCVPEVYLLLAGRAVCSIYMHRSSGQGPELPLSHET